MALAKVKDDLSRYLRLASEDEILIMRHGRPAGVQIGFLDADDGSRLSCAARDPTTLHVGALPPARLNPAAVGLLGVSAQRREVTFIGAGHHASAEPYRAVLWRSWMTVR